MERAIRVLGDIKDLSELLQGASLDQARLLPATASAAGGPGPSNGRLRLELELTRACPELQAPGGRGWGFRPRVPWVKSRLVLQQVSGASVQRLDDGSPAQVSLLACDAVSGGYTLSVTSHDGLQLVLTLEQLDGEFKDIGQPAEQH